MEGWGQTLNISSSLGMTYQVRAGPPMRTARPLREEVGINGM